MEPILQSAGVDMTKVEPAPPDTVLLFRLLCIVFATGVPLSWFERRGSQSLSNLLTVGGPPSFFDHSPELPIWLVLGMTALDSVGFLLPRRRWSWSWTLSVTVLAMLWCVVAAWVFEAFGWLFAIPVLCFVFVQWLEPKTRVWFQT